MASSERQDNPITDHDPTKFIDHLIDVDGNPIGQALIEAITNPSTDTFVLKGPAGSGKDTLTVALTTILRERGILISMVDYGEHIKANLRKGENSLEWKPRKWDDFDKDVTRSAIDRPTQPLERVLKFVKIIGTGNEKEKNRAIGTVRRLAKSRHTVVAQLVPDPRIIEQTFLVRKVVELAPPGLIEDILLKDFKIKILGLGSLKAPLGQDITTLRSNIIKKFFQRMGKKQNIEDIQEQIKYMIKVYAKEFQLTNDYFRYRLPAQFVHDYICKSLTKDHLRKLKGDLFHAEIEMWRLPLIPGKTGFILVNRYTENEIKYLFIEPGKYYKQ